MSTQPSLFPSTTSTTPASAGVVSLDEARPLLARLRIKPGLIPSAVVELGAFSVQIAWARDHKAFTASVWYKAQPATMQTMALTPNDVETRGRSHWMTDNTWRLSESGLQRVLTALAAVDVIVGPSSSP